jgi:uncharacterized protein (TIGR02271 family)
MNTMRNSTPMPATKNSTIAAYFRDPSDAERAIQQLSDAGFSKKDIGVALRDHTAEAGKTTSISSGWAGRLRSMFAPHERQEYASPDAMDVLDHMGVADEEASYYKNALRRGGVLLTVNTGTRRAQAISILRSCNAVTSDNFKSQIADSAEAHTGEGRIELLGETLRVNKERVQTGEVRLRKDVITEHQNIEVPVTREELVVEHHPVEGRPAPSGSFEGDKEIRVPVSEERVKVEKQPVVREEVSVGKRQVQDTKTVGDDVRHEELRVEKKGDVSVESEPRRKRA